MAAGGRRRRYAGAAAGWQAGRVSFFYDPANVLLSVVGIAALVVKVWALIDCCTRPSVAFPVAGKLTKIAWIAILVMAVVLGQGVFGLLGIAGLVAGIVYLVDVRPAVAGIRPGGPWG